MFSIRCAAKTAALFVGLFAGVTGSIAQGVQPIATNILATHQLCKSALAKDVLNEKMSKSDFLQIIDLFDQDNYKEADKYVKQDAEGGLYDILQGSAKNSYEEFNRTREKLKKENKITSDSRSNIARFLSKNSDRAFEAFENCIKTALTQSEKFGTVLHLDGREYVDPVGTIRFVSAPGEKRKFRITVDGGTIYGKSSIEETLHQSANFVFPIKRNGTSNVTVTVVARIENAISDAAYAVSILPNDLRPRPPVSPETIKWVAAGGQDGQDKRCLAVCRSAELYPVSTGLSDDRKHHFVCAGLINGIGQGPRSGVNMDSNSCAVFSGQGGGTPGGAVATSYYCLCSKQSAPLPPQMPPSN